MASVIGMSTAIGSLVIAGVLIFFVAYIIANSLILYHNTEVVQTVGIQGAFPIVFTLIPIAILAMFGVIIISLFK